ncbi:hypothetical protein [Labilibaculum euxinus]|uniref:Uncharacterized protein n=1 Tax=Labilibaculum euxinus TaxID=2686357 RepID=A0A7M4DB54_9BACT|nr:hypothetical protein [Labilibaculum euxinus]MUP39883.1 hypothetical protein [Labilibaculum euxinus]MVB09088.1 hypothetical protein [Labilibaculum euxinus]
MTQGLNMHNDKMSTKKENIIIDLIEDSVIASRIFDNIEKILDCNGLIINSWYPIVYLMGIDLDKIITKNQHLQDEYLETFEMYIKKENSNRDTAVLVYKKFDDMVKEHLKQFPSLRVS